MSAEAPLWTHYAAERRRCQFGSLEAWNNPLSLRVTYTWFTSNSMILFSLILFDNTKYLTKLFLKNALQVAVQSFIPERHFNCAQHWLKWAASKKQMRLWTLLIIIKSLRGDRFTNFCTFCLMAAIIYRAQQNIRAAVLTTSTEKIFSYKFLLFFDSLLDFKFDVKKGRKKRAESRSRKTRQSMWAINPLRWIASSRGH